MSNPRHHKTDTPDYLVQPDEDSFALVESWQGYDETGQAIDIDLVPEKPLTVYLNNQEIVTLMTILDDPKRLALGFLVNQLMLLPQDKITSIDFDSELSVIVVRTERETDYEAKLKKRVQTSGCAQGSSFGDLMDELDGLALPHSSPLKSSELYRLLSIINQTPSLYLKAGAIHGCVLCQKDRPLVYTEDVGRHNAVDKIAGWLFETGEGTADKSLYTTGRLTSEMVIKTVKMGIPKLISRSGFTGWSVALARQAGLLMIGRARGERFVVLSGDEQLIRDLRPGEAKAQRKQTKQEIT